MSSTKVDPEKANTALLQRFYLQSAARALLPEERVSWCLRRPIPGQKEIEVWRGSTGEGAHYRNLAVCGSVWNCAICASKITEKRKDEIRAVLNGTGLIPYLATFTLQHIWRDNLADTLSVLIAAYGQFTSGRWWLQCRARFGLVGYVRALEVTYGANGWHPHLHVLLMCEMNRADILTIRGDLSARWQQATLAHGGYASQAAGFNLKASPAEIADYITKFGHEPRDIESYGQDKIEFEMTKTMMKRGREKGLTMTQLLTDYAGGNREVGVLWREFARTFKGRRMLEWSRSPDLRKLAGLSEDKTDEQLAEEHTEEAVLLARLTLEQWRVILANDIRAEVLALARTGDGVAINAFVAEFIPRNLRNRRGRAILSCSDDMR